MVYPALLPLMRTPRLPVVDRTDAPAELNGLVRFAERRNLVSARVPSHFKRSLLGNSAIDATWGLIFGNAETPSFFLCLHNVTTLKQSCKAPNLDPYLAIST